MPKPNFVKKPMDKIMDEPLSKLPNQKEFAKPPKHKRRFLDEMLAPEETTFDEELEEKDLLDIMRDLGDKD